MLLDAYGQPIKPTALRELQSEATYSRIPTHHYHSLTRVSPKRAAAFFQQADEGDILSQMQLFRDMQDDSHLSGEFNKRCDSLNTIDSYFAAPDDANALEAKALAFVEDVLSNPTHPFEDLIRHLMEAVGYGFSAAELEWQKIDGYLLPTWHPRPQTWFRWERTRKESLLLNDSANGSPLKPMGWIYHMPGLPATGYAPRMGLFRGLTLPFIYKHYSAADFAEFLETFGLPMIIGKHPATASDSEKSALMRAVVALGHRARAIMPENMRIDFEQAARASASGSQPMHLTFVEYAEKAMTKAILGQTLTSGADGKSSTNALGKVHNEIRKDIIKSDAKGLATTINRELIYPLIQVNIGNIPLARCPKIVFDTEDTEDMTVFSESMTKLVSVGYQIPRKWAQKKLGIPEPGKGEDVLSIGTASPAPPAQALSATLREATAMALQPPYAEVVAKGSQHTSDEIETLLQQIEALVNNADSLVGLQSALVVQYGALDTTDLERVMAAGFALAQLKGLAGETPN